MAEKKQRDFKKRDDKFAGRDRDRNHQSRAPRDTKPREAKKENVVEHEVAVDENSEMMWAVRRLACVAWPLPSSL